MTIIQTVVSPLGIIQMSDSFVTYGDTVTKEKDKVFSIPVEHGGFVAVAGSYTVGGVPMDEWMRTLVELFELAHPAPRSPETFASFLAERLQINATPDECTDAGFFHHVAGYGLDGSGSYRPEMHFVRNVYQMNKAGDYADYRSTFQTSEDFWSRYSDPEDKEQYKFAISLGSPLQFFNGLRSGRQALVDFGRALVRVFHTAWNDHRSAFQRPTTLWQLQDIYKLWA